MQLVRKQTKVDCFKLTRDMERVSPEWFKKEVIVGNIYIDHAISDGHVMVYGCTISTSFGNLKAKVGDYLIRETSGLIYPVKEKELKKFFLEK